MDTAHGTEHCNLFTAKVTFTLVVVFK